MDRRKKGEFFEQLAKEFLINHGQKHIASNFSCRQGEIDLVMKDRNTLVFVEVKFRATDRFGSCIEAVTPQKQKKVILASQNFIQKYTWANTLLCRFDVVGISPKKHRIIKHEENMLRNSNKKQNNSHDAAEYLFEWIPAAFIEY